MTYQKRAPGVRFWYVIIQISRDIIPAAYENEKNFHRLTPSLTCMEGYEDMGGYEHSDHSLNLNDPHMQMSYIWARMLLKRGPSIFSAW